MQNWQFTFMFLGFFLNLAAIIVGIFYNNARIDRLEDKFDAKFDRIFDLLHDQDKRVTKLETQKVPA